MAHVCLSPGLHLRSHVTQSTSEEDDVGSLSQGGGGKEEVWKPEGFRRGRSLTGGRSASEETWVAASRGQPATCLAAMALQLQPRPVRLVAQPERGDCPARGQWALPVVGLTSCSPAPATHCVTLAMSPPLCWPLYLVQNGLHHLKPAHWWVFRGVWGACEETERKTHRK